MASEIDNTFGESISTYTSNEASEDGMLFDIRELDSSWKAGIFTYVTTNLMQEHDYIQRIEDCEKVNISNMLDLLNQANEIVRKSSNNFKDTKEPFYSGNIELPSGGQQKIYIEMNETGNFTILLPEDH